MRALIVFSCLAFAAARPEAGYSYQRPGGSGLSGVSGSSFGIGHGGSSFGSGGVCVFVLLFCCLFCFRFKEQKRIKSNHLSIE